MSDNDTNTNFTKLAEKYVKLVDETVPKAKIKALIEEWKKEIQEDMKDLTEGRIAILHLSSSSILRCVLDLGKLLEDKPSD